ncbi:MAG: hypothetical protein IJH07_01470 [Ruminococcus sp.]|nr:hypothetical protein [Ruminococcus sp.]MBQ9515959.1 hypothetical protein [Ruminococcus sp.]
MKILKRIRMIVALVLTLTIALIVPLQTSAAASGGKYVSEVYVAYGKDAEAAKKTLSDKGFTPVEGNLSDGGKTYAMMGYKTTDNIRDSITDLAVMNMHGDYSVEDYKNLLKKQKTEVAEFLNEFMTVIKEYRTNLKAGKTKATYVHDVLNKYTDDDTGMKMGDLLNSETLQDKVGISESVEAANPENLPNLVTILMQGNAQVIKSVETLLSMATDTADNTWIDRFATASYDNLLDKVEKERPELNTENKRVQYLDNVYGDDAAALGLAVTDLRGMLTDYENSKLHIDTATEEDIKNAFGDIKNDPTALVKYQDWLSIGSIYEGLKNYEGGNYKKGELLSFFLEEHDPEDVEIFIPMAASLSDGQRYGLPFVSLEQLTIYAFLSEEEWKEHAEENVSGFEKLKEVSVYQNIDRGLYKDDGSVALTGSAQRANNTADGTTGTEKEQLDTFAKITAISWMATAASFGLTLVSMAARSGFIKIATAGFEKIPQAYELVIDEIFDAKTFASTREYLGPENSSFIRVRNARYSVITSRVFVFITVALAVFSAVMTIIDLCRDKSIEQLPIPNYLVNNYTDADGGSYTLNYKAVECNRMEYFGEGYKIQKGDSADLLADEGKQWLVLYASKNSKAGKPLTPDFVVQKSNKAPSGYEGFVHLIGEKGAVNVVSGAFKNYSTFSTVWQSVAGDYSMYIFSKLSNDVKTYDESAGNMTASAVGGGMIAIWGFGGLALGAVLGVLGTILVKRKKKTEV